MKLKRQVVVFDAADLEAESSYWARLLGGTVHRDDDWHSVVVDGQWRFGVQLAPDHVAPDWPDGQPEQQIHLDLHVTEGYQVDADHRRPSLLPLLGPVDVARPRGVTSGETQTSAAGLRLW